MTEFYLTILSYIFVVAFIIITIIVINMSLVPKFLLCAKFYCFFFEQDDWLLYKKAKKQGIQHYLNNHHFSQFYEEWSKVKDEYGVNNISENDYLKLDKETKHALHIKYNELSEKYYYKEYNDAFKRINDDDIVLSLNEHSGRLYIEIGMGDKGLLIWEPMVRDILKGCEIWANGKTDNINRLLTNPKEVVSF